MVPCAREERSETLNCKLCCVLVRCIEAYFRPRRILSDDDDEAKPLPTGWPNKVTVLTSPRCAH